MKLYYKDKLTAYQQGNKMIKCNNPKWHEVPFGLFGLHNELDTCSTLKLIEWAQDRCFPPERMDAREVLESLGLDTYDRLLIVERTGAQLVCLDYFWVDFETENSIHEWKDEW